MSDVKTNKILIEKLEICFDNLHQEAIKEYQSTTEYSLLQQEIDRLYECYSNCFINDEYRIALDLIGEFQEVYEYQQRYLYRQGIRNGIALLLNQEITFLVLSLLALHTKMSQF